MACRGDRPLSAIVIGWADRVVAGRFGSTKFSRKLSRWFKPSWLGIMLQTNGCTVTLSADRVIGKPFRRRQYDLRDIGI